MERYDDAQIIHMLEDAKTRNKAFEEIVKQYSEPLYWKIRRIVFVHEDANDILQNVFIKIWNNIADFRSESKLSTWLFRVAINESIDFVRRNKNQRSNLLGSDDDSLVCKLMADEYFDGDETEALLQEAVSKLPEVQRVVFTMRYYDDMKYSEMSKILKTSEGALKASYHIAANKIADFFRSQD